MAADKETQIATSRSSRQDRIDRWLQILNHPIVWEISRISLDLTIGLYRKRMDLLREWGILDNRPSVIDIGCGIGQYSTITEGEYLGIDLNQRYIEYAQKRNVGRRFHCGDVTQWLDDNVHYDIVLMVDFLHHLPGEACHDLLRVAAALSSMYVVSFEPITEQYNRVGQWFIDHDRGAHIRPLNELHRLFEASPLSISDSRDLMCGPLRLRAILARA